MRRRALLAFTALLGVALAPGVVQAHAMLLRADPPAGSVLAAAPELVRLWFTEPVHPVGDGVIVIAPSGRRVERGVARAGGALPLRPGGGVLNAAIDASEHGTYLVLWQVISNDTHPERGRFAFSVGAASAVSPAALAAGRGGGSVATSGLLLQALARWLHFGGYALAFGPFAFVALALRPARLGDAASARRLARLVMVGVGLLALAEPLALLAQIASLRGGALFDSAVAGDALSSSFGRVFAQRLGAAVLLWVILGATGPHPPALSPNPGRRRVSRVDGACWAALALGVALALVDVQASHAVGAGPLLPGLLANTLHVTAMGCWLGGLAALLALWRTPSLRGARADLARRFGQIAAVAVATLALSGLLLAALRLARPAELLSTGYGRALTAKLALVALALLLALGGRRALRGRRRWWTAEGAALLGVLALAGLLVSLPPPQ